MKSLGAIIFIFILLFQPHFSFAEEKEKSQVPRFVSLRSDQVNVRSGPGAQYPIKWVMVKEKMPVEVIAEFEDWRKIRDIEQAEGWVHKAMLSPRRTALIKGKGKKIYSENNTSSKLAGIGNNGVIVKVDKCDGTMCKIENDKVEGYIPMSDIWGVYEGENFKK